jgi:hypothetical protein
MVKAAAPPQIVSTSDRPGLWRFWAPFVVAKRPFRPCKKAVRGAATQA